MNTGYQGRTACGQLAVIDEELREAILAHQPAGALRRMILERGPDLVTDARRLLEEGRTTEAEVLRVLGERVETEVEGSAMPWYGYEGLTPGESAISGSLEADTRESAERLLAKMQIEVRTLGEVEPPRSEGPAALGADDLLFFNEQLATLAEAGIALDEGLQQLARDVSSPSFRKWIEGLVVDLKQGMAIDEAIARREKGLPLLYSQVVRAGIKSGDLPATLMNLNQHLRLVGTTKTPESGRRWRIR